MAKELWRWSATDLAAAIRRRDISAREATEAHLARLDAVNPSINAVTVPLHESALAAAELADQMQARDLPLGPLHGVPVTIKENVDQAGCATTNGIPAFESVIAETDSPVVANMRVAGAIIIGRTNTPEFSLRWFTNNPLRGETLNPWDRTVTPGGSSGGAGAALAAGLGPIAHGNDLGGSLRYPAYCCGVTAIRPTLGRVPAASTTATTERPPIFQLMSVQGPMAREIRDLRLGLAAMAAGDARDPWWVPAPLQGPPVARPIKVAVSLKPAGGGIDESVVEAVKRAAGALAKAGYAVEEREPPAVDTLAETWSTMLLSDTERLMEESMRAVGSDDIVQVLEGYKAAWKRVDLTGYLEAFNVRTRLLREWMVFMEDYPLVLGPVSTEPPFAAGDDLTGDNRVTAIVNAQRLLVAVNVTGLPSVAVPAGRHGDIPIGVQIIGQRYREDLCLDAAEAVERAYPTAAPIDPVT